MVEPGWGNTLTGALAPEATARLAASMAMVPLTAGAGA